MPVFQQGTLNATSLIVPDLYVQIVPPQVSLLNGVPTDILGVVGTAQWGPVGAPVIISDMNSYAQTFGAVQARKFDMGTALAAAVLQGANNFRCVRVTDGTDAAASIVVAAGTAGDATAIRDAINNGISGVRGPSKLIVASAATTNVTYTSMYTGTLGNTATITIGPGSKASTYKITITMSGQVPEIFDNVGTAVGTVSTSNLTGGTDGVATITASVLIGVDTVPRKGMYALRNTGASIAMLADADDSTQWTTQVAFGLAEGIYMILVGPAGQTVATAVTAKSTAGIDSYAAKLLLGDWCYFQDNVNNQLRLISPQGFVAGRLANLSPEQSMLNKPIYGIVNTQATASSKIYSSAELALLVNAGIDLITNPIPGGNFFGCRVGHNTSSNPVINGDNYTRMTNYIAYTFNAGMGRFIGRLGSPLECAEAWATIDSFGAIMKNRKPEPMISDYFVSPISAPVNGLQTANVKVTYLGIVEKFLINVEGGTSVQITRASTLPA